MGRKTYLVTYSNEKYRKQQDELMQKAIYSGGTDKPIFDRFFNWTEDQLKKEFPLYWEQNKHILEQPRGAGFWNWKSKILLETLYRVNSNDVLLYMDCGDCFVETDGLRETLLNCEKTDGVYLTAGAFPNYQYTKRDCFFFMGCDEEKYHKAIQVEAGIIVVQNTSFAQELMMNWNYWSRNRHVITDEPNFCGLPNLEGFLDGRHDQSILSLLAMKHNIIQGNLFRKFIKCNCNDNH